MATAVLTIQPPVGGISRQSTYQTQPPFNSFDSENYWPIDVKTGRLTTAIRPALKLFGSRIEEVAMVSPVSGTHATLPAKSFAASFNGTLFYWDGTTMVQASGSKATSIDTGGYVSAAAIENQLVIVASGANDPLVFDYAGSQDVEVIVESTSGTMPQGASIAVNWKGALWLAKDNILYASRVGDITDWDFTVLLDDEFGAFFTDGDFKGTIAGPITAVMPQVSDVMMVSTVSGTLAMRGHPRQGGTFEAVGTSYALGQGAWCLTPDNTLVMLTPLGLMALPPEPGAVFTPISDAKIPNELKGLSYDRDDPLVNLIYDSRWNGIHIYVRGAEEQAWLFDLTTGGFHKMEVGSYPFAVAEFADFITENTSGVLLGRYDGIRTYDRFATEDINGALVIGPVKISKSIHHASKIINARVVFARDTPTGSGTLNVATGIDGQDAVNRLLQGEHQYSIPISVLAANNGLCFPSIAGHAAVFSFSTQTGDLAIEEITCTIEQMGRNTFNRATQLAVEGEATTFTGAFVELDTSVWEGYAEVDIPIGPDENLPDHTHFLDLSLMSTDWWTQVALPNGEDIRAADVFGIEAPATLIDYSHTVGASSGTGMLAFRMSQTTAPRSVRVWAGNSGAVKPSSTASNGSDNVFDANWRSFWPNGAGDSNITSYGNNTATSNEGNGVSDALEAVYGDETGPMGADATDFNLGGDTWWEIASWPVSQSLTTQDAWTLVAAFKRTAAVSGNEDILAVKGGSLHTHRLEVDEDTNRAQTRFTSFDGGSDDQSVVIGTTEPQPVWIHHAGVVASDTSRTAYVEGVAGTPNTATTDPLLDSKLLAGNTIFAPNGHVAMLQVHDTARSAAWIKFQNDMMDQATFWGTFGAFVLVNTIVPPVLDTDACPTGPVSQTETGTTAGYVLLDPTDPTDGSVNDFSLLIDLTLLPTLWWDEVDASGSNVEGIDIRATKTDNTIIPFDLIEFDESARTGLGIIKLTQGEGGPSSIRLWAGNASSITVNPCNAYGRYSAYDAAWRGFWPSGSGTDRTQFVQAMTSVGSPSSLTTGSPVGSEATNYDNASGTNQYASVALNETGDNKVPSSGTFTLMASAVRSEGPHEDMVLLSVQDASSRSGTLLHTRPSSTPARLTNRNAYGSEATAGNSATITPTTAWFQAGTTFGNNTRISYVDANTGSSSTNQTTLVLSDLDTIVIGAETGDSFLRGFNGQISLVGLHTVGRGTAWLNYWNKSLTQSTFWTVNVWTADLTALS